MSVLRCPTCAAGVPAGADWCTLCYADLRPTRPGTAPAAGASTEAAAVATLPVVEPEVVAAQGPRWGCRCGARVPYELLTCPTCAHQPLAGPPLAPALRLADPRARVGVMVGGSVAVVAALTLLLWLLGSLL